MLGRIWNLITKEFYQLRRDRLLVGFLILGPLLQLVLLAQATGGGVRHVATAALDMDRSSLSRQLIQHLDNAKELDIRYHPADFNELKGLLDQGKAHIGIVIPANWREEITRGGPSYVQVLGDGSNYVVAAIGMSAAQAAVNDFIAKSLAGPGMPQIKTPELSVSVLYNPELRTKNYTIPAQLGFIVYQVTLVVAAMGIAREREVGTLEQLLVTPLRRLELLVGKATPAFLVGTINFLTMFLVARLIFHTPMRGSFGLLLGMTLLFLFAELAWGLMISILSRSQQQAVLLVFVLAIIDMTLSGYLVQVDKMPWFLGALSHLFPLQYYLASIRAIMLKGAGLYNLPREIIALIGLGLLTHTLVFFRLSKRLD